MTRRVWSTFLVVGIFLLALCVPSRSQGPTANPDKLAKVMSETASHESEPGMVADSGLPLWLENLLTSVPTKGEDDGLVDEFEEELKDAQEKAEKKSVELFPRPPDIQPLYTSPVLEGEGKWTADGMPTDSLGRPLVYKTVYRPSVEYPNSVVYMAEFDMKRIKPRFFVGSTEPGINEISSWNESEERSKIVAITNAMWMQRHARGAGAIFRGQVIYPMVDGMATLIVFKDDSVAICEWSKDIPLDLVRDARQLRHLIVKHGKVVESVVKHGKFTDSEIGLGFLIDSGGGSTRRRKFWFLANRTAFGIREDGNLVFAMGHHVSTKDLAKALVLAGCKNALHGDANIDNIVCNFYFRDEHNKIVKRDRLSPEQRKYTMKRYDQGYSKDFFAFYEK